MVLDEGFTTTIRNIVWRNVDALLRDFRYIVGIRMHHRGKTMAQARNSFVKKDDSNRSWARWKRSAARAILLI